MRLLVLLALVACKANSIGEAPVTRVAVIPDSILGSLGTIGLGLAVDFHDLDVATVAALLPDDPPCVRELVKSVRFAAVTQTSDQWQGYVTGVAPTALHDCVAGYVKLSGLAVKDLGSGFEIDRGESKVAAVSWRDNTALITQGSNAPHAGDPPGVILDLLARVPHAAKGWIVASGFPEAKIKNTVAWLETDGKTWTFTVEAEGAAQDVVKPWLDSIAAGFASVARQKGVVIDAAWFTITGTPISGRLVATIPISAFQVK
jgi:hypothetical protein